MATQDYHLKVLRTIHAMARYNAREETKRAIRARGEKISAYAPRDIYRTGDELLEDLMLTPRLRQWPLGLLSRSRVDRANRS
jgi:hypothetical protein